MYRFGKACEFGITRPPVDTVDVELPIYWTFEPSTPLVDQPTLSNGNLTATTDTSFVGVWGRDDRNSGKRVFSYTSTFSGLAADQEVIMAVYDIYHSSNIFVFLDATGNVYDATFVPVDVGQPFTSGSTVKVFVNFDLGMLWFDNGSNSTAVDREAGTNPHFTFPPNTHLTPYSELHATSAPNTSSITLNPTITNGTYTALNL